MEVVSSTMTNDDGRWGRIMSVRWDVYCMVMVGGIPNQTKVVINHDVEANWPVRQKRGDAGMGGKCSGIYML